MIDFIKEFDKFVSNYDIGNERIKLKYNHSYRVMKLSEKYSKKIGFSKEDIELAKIIGLLHDIGRFEQVKLYNTFNDKESVDHALLGVKLLFEDGLISKFWDKEEDYEIIKYSIINHNYDLLELVPKPFSKATGIEMLIKKLDIPIDNTYAFGDSFNDLEMLQYVRYGVCMGNSDPELFKFTDYRTSDYDKGGVTQALIKFGLI